MLTRRFTRPAAPHAASEPVAAMGEEVVVCEALGETGDMAGRSEGIGCVEAALIGDVGRDDAPEPARDGPPPRAGGAMRGALDATEFEEELG